MSRILWLAVACCSLSVACGATTGSRQAPASGGGPKPVPGALMVEDFEDGDGTSLLGSSWYTFDDKSNGGGSDIRVERGPGGGVKMVGDGNASGKSILVEFSFVRGTLPYEPFVGFGVKLPPKHQDLSAYGALEYAYRGAAHEVRIETANVEKWDFHAVRLPQSTAWTSVQLPYPLFRQGGWGPKVPFEVTSARQISWHVRGKDGQSGKLQVDDLRLVPATAIERGEPNLTIHDPAPPPKETIESVVVNHPLQKVAMASLDKGYNLASFLEAKRFDGFGDFGEGFVKKLAAAGYKGLRLPVDLDKYVLKATPKGDTVELQLHPDLFKVLDAYDRWTAAAGLSLTIDYHQYDHSFEVDKPESVALMVALWGEVAKHFAASPRKDLFYELLNEPELAAGARGPTQSEWTAVSQRMIAAIRRHDATRPILFGDVKWYNIDKLVKREPFDDANVIYVFHYYEPFIFTHQGASWASMGSVHDVPYPYRKGRWSDRMEDLGFTKLNEDWQIRQLRNYHKQGNATRLRNDILEVKRWAVKHQVPIICNEFGVHMATSRKEDVVRYYTDLIGIFQELEIPWQSWFKLMDPKTGKVDPAYRKALRLD